MRDLQTDQKIVVLVTIAALGLTPAICDAQCDPIESGETKIDCPIIGPSYSDCWTFEGEVDDRVIITTVRTSGSLYPQIYLRDPSGAVEAQPSPGSAIKLDHQLQQSGTYTIIVQDYYLT
ncbi:MAG: PPC domain-containing protein, partial [Planctomycetota bacterium]